MEVRVNAEAPLPAHVQIELAEIGANVTWFSETPERWRTLARFANGQTSRAPGELSLRVLEWFVINYAKQHDYKVTGPDGIRTTLFGAYQDTLNTYEKTRFDPFARTGTHVSRSEFVEFAPTDPETGEKVQIRTNRRQLNFFRWVIEHGVLPLAEAARDAVKRDMKEAQKRRVRRPPGKRQQHKPLTVRSFREFGFKRKVAST